MRPRRRDGDTDRRTGRRRRRPPHERHGEDSVGGLRERLLPADPRALQRPAEPRRPQPEPVRRPRGHEADRRLPRDDARMRPARRPPALRALPCPLRRLGQGAGQRDLGRLVPHRLRPHGTRGQIEVQSLGGRDAGRVPRRAREEAGASGPAPGGPAARVRSGRGPHFETPVRARADEARPGRPEVGRVPARAVQGLVRGAQRSHRRLQGEEGLQGEVRGSRRIAPPHEAPGQRRAGLQAADLHRLLRRGRREDAGVQRPAREDDREGHRGRARGRRPRDPQGVQPGQIVVRPIIVLALLWLVAQDNEKRRDELASKLESLRGLKFKAPLVLREGTRREYAAYVLDNAKRVYGADLPSAEKGLKALGLPPPKLRLDVALTAQAGLGTKVFCAGGEVILLDPKAGDEWILNKMDLGLVDQHFAAPAAATFDAQMAWAALRMGDAEVVKHLIWTSNKITDETVKKVADEAAAWEKGDSKLASVVAPRLFVRSAEFPWRRGAVFALTQFTLGKLDQAYAKPPVSTEQVLHPEKYQADEKPITIDPAPVEGFLAGKGYKPVYRTVLGELGVAMGLETHFPREDLSSV